jgi:maleylpyruvate isomerase
MKLYSLDESPFAARVRIQAYVKDIPLDILPPPGGLRSDELCQLTPLGRIPVLALRDMIIVESEVIQEYLEDRFPEPGLRGASPEQTARIRMLSRITDLYLIPCLLPLRARLKGRTDGSDSLADQVESLRSTLVTLNYFMSDGPFAATHTLSLADCSLGPVYFYVDYFAAALEIDLKLNTLTRFYSWTKHIEKDAAVNRVLDEMRNAVQQRRL